MRGDGASRSSFSKAQPVFTDALGSPTRLETIKEKLPAPPIGADFYKQYSPKKTKKKFNEFPAEKKNGRHPSGSSHQIMTL